MKKLNEEIIQFLQKQGFVIVSTLDRNGKPHNACKGIVNIKPRGLIYLLDLYKGRTFENLKRNPRISITAVDGHKFVGYCLKGKAKIIGGEKLKSQIIKAWEDRIVKRVTQRVLKNIKGKKGHPRHPEVLLPEPQYLIIVEAEEIIDLTPQHLKPET